VDLLPTVLAVVGIDPATYAGPGSSILGSHDPGEERLSFSEADGRCFPRFGLVGRRYKYIYTPRDPMQTLLQNSPLFRDRFYRRRIQTGELAPEERADDRELERSLRALGYIR
jgi:hypothetical protein